MSNDEKSNESEDLTNKVSEAIDDATEKVSEVIDDATEKVSEVIDDVTEKASEVIDDATESVNEAVDSASDAAGSMVSKIMAFKESNPKVFYGGIGGLVLVILVLMMSGGGSKPPLPTTQFANVSIGQSYELKGVNTYDPKAMVQILPVPGSIAAYDEDPNETGNVCKYMPQGTKVKAVQFQEAFGNVRFVQIEMLNGECAGKKGWVISNNLK